MCVGVCVHRVTGKDKWPGGQGGARSSSLHGDGTRVTGWVAAEAAGQGLGQGTKCFQEKEKQRTRYVGMGG